MAATQKQTVSLLYFLVFAAMASAGRFMAIFFRDDLGLSAGETGYVLASGTFIGLFSTPAWSAVCDYLQEKRTVLVISVIGGSCAALLYLAPLFTDAVRVGGSAVMWTMFCRCLYCFWFSPSVGILDSIAVNDLASKSDFGQCRLWGSLAWGLVSLLVIGPLLDNGSGGWVQPVGFVIFALPFMLVAYYNLSAGSKPPTSATPSPSTERTFTEKAAYARFEDDDCCNGSRARNSTHTDEEKGEEDATRLENGWEPFDDSLFKPFEESEGAEEAEPEDPQRKPQEKGGEERQKQKPKKLDQSKEVLITVETGEKQAGGTAGKQKKSSGVGGEESSTGVWKKIPGYILGVLAVLKKTISIIWAERWLSLVFFLFLFVMGGTTCLVEGLVFLYFTSELGMSNTVCGLSVLITVSFEIPIFHYRYTTVSDPLWILLVEPLHGVTFACRTLAAVHYAAELAPPGLEVSAQGLGNTVNCLGVIAGSVIGGRIMQEKGSVYMYRAAGGLAFVTLVVYLLVTLSYLGLSSLVEVRSTSESRSSKASKAGRQEQDACASLEEPPEKTAGTVLFKRIELEDL